MRNQAREYFKKCDLTYEDINMNDIYYLIQILNKEMFNDNILIMMNEPIFKGKGKNIKLDKNNKIVFAGLTAKGNYFLHREAITFNEDGFIGFCGWADDKRTEIFASGFVKWCDYLKNKKSSESKIEFLTKRENKLQQIETMFKNEKWVDLKKLSELVKGE